MKRPDRAPEPAGASWEAIGTTITLRVAEPSGLAAARAAVEAEIAAIDLACSRFREDSELMRVNARAGRPVRVSRLFAQALALALRAAALTDGDVDPTVGRALALAGYDRDFSLLRPIGPAGSPAGEPPVVHARFRSGWEAVALDEQTPVVRVPLGVALDLGATAKAWAADRAAAEAARAGGCGVLVSVGGDIALAGAAPAGGWQVHVTDDHRSDASAPGQTIALHSGGLATSSTTVRRWSHEGRRMHHIIDPSTGLPAQGAWRTVSVAAATCADANIAATAALVRGEPAAAWLAGLGLPARLLAHDGRVVTIAGWPAEERPAQAGRERAA